MAPPRQFSHEDAVRRVLAGETYTEVAESFGVGVVAILSVFRKTGLVYHSAQPPCSLNHDFFKDVTTEKQAYFLGLLAADGCVTGKCVCLKLAESDAHIVEEFRTALGSTHKLYHSTHKKGYKPGSLSVELKFSSPRMLIDLAKLGIVPRKSLTAEAWVGPEHLMRHYWRGVIDGDGWIGKKYPFQLGLVGSKSMVTSFTEYAHRHAAANINISPCKSVWKTHLNTITAQRMACHLYSGSTVSLNRKRERAEHLMSQTFRGNFQGWDSISREQVIDLLNEHRSWTAAADVLGVPMTTLRTYAARKFKLSKRDIPRCHE